MRGNPHTAAPDTDNLGSIPAHAGEPRMIPRHGPLAGVYPRACGGTAERVRAALAVEGLSPRMRGNRDLGGVAGSPGGSIPAHAGEPASAVARMTVKGVYPRVCGGTLWAVSHCLRGRGLSPRMRGNRTGPQVPPWITGSIPAYAGEPPLPCRRRSLHRVYPRVCGGTIQPDYMELSLMGLSPRMRGNPPAGHRSHGRPGSIPAYAGNRGQASAP